VGAWMRRPRIGIWITGRSDSRNRHEVRPDVEVGDGDDVHLGHLSRRRRRRERLVSGPDDDRRDAEPRAGHEVVQRPEHRVGGQHHAHLLGQFAQAGLDHTFPGIQPATGQRVLRPMRAQARTAPSDHHGQVRSGVRPNTHQADRGMRPGDPGRDVHPFERVETTSHRSSVNGSVIGIPSYSRSGPREMPRANLASLPYPTRRRRRSVLLSRSQPVSVTVTMSSIRTPNRPAR
jgi:hypothetical protein